MAGIAVPTLIIGNAEDYVHPLSYAEELAALISTACLRVITSKTVCAEKYTREFSEALAGFFAEEHP